MKLLVLLLVAGTASSGLAMEREKLTAASTSYGGGNVGKGEQVSSTFHGSLSSGGGNPGKDLGDGDYSSATGVGPQPGNVRPVTENTGLRITYPGPLNGYYPVLGLQHGQYEQGGHHEVGLFGQANSPLGIGAYEQSGYLGGHESNIRLNVGVNSVPAVIIQGSYLGGTDRSRLPAGHVQGSHLGGAEFSSLPIRISGGSHLGGAELGNLPTGFVQGSHLSGVTLRELVDLGGFGLTSYNLASPASSGSYGFGPGQARAVEEGRLSLDKPGAQSNRGIVKPSLTRTQGFSAVHGSPLGNIQV